MHDGQVEVSAGALAAAIARQFPEHTGRHVRRLDSAGTVVAPFRVGDDLLARVHLVPEKSSDARRRLHHEQAHASYLRGRLPVEVPSPVGEGEPFPGYPEVWSLWTWLEGDSLDHAPVADDVQLARDVGALIRAHQSMPTGGRSWNGVGRGGTPLQDSEWVRSSIEKSAHLVDTAEVTRAWERALRADPHHGGAVYIHGDPMPGNFLVRDDHLTGMVDVSVPVFGDPAADLQPAWVMFEEPARSVFLDEMGLDDAARERGRGWALEMAIGGLHYYEHTNPVFFRQAARTLQRLMVDAMPHVSA